MGAVEQDAGAGRRHERDPRQFRRSGRPGPAGARGIADGCDPSRRGGEHQRGSKEENPASPHHLTLAVGFTWARVPNAPHRPRRFDHFPLVLRTAFGRLTDGGRRPAQKGFSRGPGLPKKRSRTRLDAARSPSRPARRLSMTEQPRKLPRKPFGYDPTVVDQLMADRDQMLSVAE